MRKCKLFIGCPDFVSLTEKLLMARNFFRIFTENNPARGPEKIYNIPDVNWLKYTGFQVDWLYDLFSSNL